MKHSAKLTIKKWFTAITTITALSLSFSGSVLAIEKLEKETIKLGFIKLTDMAPLAVAYEKGYFDEEGLSVQDRKSVV